MIVPQLISIPGIQEACVRRHTELAVSSLFVINSAIMFKGLMDWYLARLESGGYPGIVLLMAMESSILPLPSELVIPPAAHLAHTRGNLSMIGIIIAGTLGSWLGATAMYWASRLAGRPLMMRYGRMALITPEKIEGAERWAARFGSMGSFI